MNLSRSRTLNTNLCRAFSPRGRMDIKQLTADSRWYSSNIFSNQSASSLLEKVISITLECFSTVQFLFFRTSLSRLISSDPMVILLLYLFLRTFFYYHYYLGLLFQFLGLSFKLSFLILCLGLHPFLPVHLIGSIGYSQYQWPYK